MKAPGIRVESNVQAVFSPLYDERYELPLLLSRIPAGFPSPAESYAEESLDLNRYLIRHPVATFFVRVQGDSMTGAHIFDGDLLVVDRAEEVRGNHIILAQIGGETVVKRLRRIDDQLWLCSENPAFPNFPITEEAEAVIWGRVMHSVTHHCVMNLRLPQSR
ncbi:MAG: LexA repressor [Gammaproteobacteria bacterium]|nr:LexA repressor [Gammaproteobacteria bacterium]MCG3145708.1 LexA repressor [Gammaproteobacteria bacterium]